MVDALRGMKLDEAVILLKAAGIEPAIEYADPPFSSFDGRGRTSRVVLFKNGTLLVSLFRDSVPEA